MRRLSSIIGIILLLTGCMRPHYQPPYVSIPDSWRIDADESSTLCNMRWWEQFQDPVLNGLIITALRNNQDLKVAIARVFEYQARLGITNADLYPSVYGNALYTRTQLPLTLPTAPLSPGVSRIQNNFQLYFSLAWQLDFWGRLRSASEASYAELLAQVEARRAVAVTVVTSVANTYILLRQLDGQLEVSRKTLESRLESLKLATYRFELGETSEIEVKQAEAEVEDAAIRMLEFEREIPQQENLLSILLGENPRSIERGLTLDLFQYPVTVPTGLPSDLLSRRPDIVQAEESLIAANARVAEAKALFFPQITLTGLYGNESAKLSDLLTSPAQIWQYGITVLEPIFDAGKTGYRVDAARAIRTEALYTYFQTILNAFREVNDALIAYQKNLQLVKEHQRQVNVLRDYLKLAQLRYEEGEIDYLNVLDAERSLFDAQLQLVQAQAESFIALVQLYGALGGGWVIEVDAIALTDDDCVLNE